MNACIRCGRRRWLPVLYLGAATFMSFGCVAGTTMLCCLVWKRAMDMDVLDEAARITAWLIFGWMGLRLLDILFRGALFTAFHFDRFAGVFWLEMALVAAGGYLLRQSLQNHNRQKMFLGYILSSAGGMIYRFSPTTWRSGPIPKRCISRSPSKFWFHSALSLWELWDS